VAAQLRRASLDVPEAESGSGDRGGIKTRAIILNFQLEPFVPVTK
jgi:hypothetical protein